MIEDKPEGETERRRKKGMSPELRRFLGPARSLHDRPEAEQEAEKEIEPDFEEPPQATKPPPKWEEEEETPRLRPLRQERPDPESGDRTARSAVVLAPATELSRAIQMQTVALIIGGLFLLGGVFYVGKKFEYLRYLITSANKPKLNDPNPDKFPGMSVEDLVEQGLANERLGNWSAAIDRFMSAKRKNLAYRGILYRVGKLYYDHGNLDVADKVFENAITFGEDVAASNYLRGMIATGRNNLPAAEGFFEAAAVAEPFNSVHYYNWADALRRNHHARQAIPIYERGATRSTSDRERAVYKFKARMTMIEAGEIAPLSEEVEAKQATGKLPIDWLMTAAALRINEGKIPDAVQLIDKARTADSAGLYSLFSSCANDLFFSNASEKYPEVARACGLPTSSGLGLP